MAENANQLTPKRFKEILMTVLAETKGLPEWMKQDVEKVDKQNRGWLEQPKEAPK